MALTSQDIALLTSAYGVGREEAIDLGALLNALEGHTATEISRKASRAVDHLAALGVIGGDERRDFLVAAEKAIAGTPDEERDADVINLFTRRLSYLGPQRLSAILDEVYTVPEEP